ncbi:MAG: diaminopimelate epimerase [Acidobacteria bacterium]|nr:diaminopimelate epimerase [Acidobacteriota bacterium]
MRVAKAHAYGNDFIYLRYADAGEGDPVALARHICHRGTGLGADGLILFDEHPDGATMRLINSDGSPSEVSGNGVRGLAALLAYERGMASGHLRIHTDAGEKTLDLLATECGYRFLFKAHMGQVRDVRDVRLEIAGLGRVHAVRLNIGNPQCVVLVDDLDPGILPVLGPALQVHPEFPEGVNVEIAHAESRDRVRILIWERGCGPTLSSGTGSCASAISARHRGLVDGDVDVVAPGGSQRVVMRDDDVWLTGWADVVAMATWIP